MTEGAKGIFLKALDNASAEQLVALLNQVTVVVGAFLLEEDECPPIVSYTLNNLSEVMDALLKCATAEMESEITLQGLFK